MQRHAAQEGDAELLGLQLGAAVAEDVGALAALGADEVAHVLDDAEHRHVHLAEHVEALAGIDQRQVLRRRDDDGARQRHLLRHGELHVAGAGRHVDDQRRRARPTSTSRSIWVSAETTIGPRQMMGVPSSTRKPIDMAFRP